MNFRTMLSVLTVTFCGGAAVALGAAAGQAVKPIPVKAEMLDGTRLVLRSAGCSLDSPGAGWKWMTYEGAGQNYFCLNASTHAMFLVEVGQLHGAFTDHQPQSLLEGMRKFRAANGGKLEDDHYEWIELPGTVKCTRVSFTDVDKTGRRQCVVVYIAQTTGQVTVKLQYNGPASAEPVELTRMVRSLRMLPGSGDAAPKTPEK